MTVRCTVYGSGGTVIPKPYTLNLRPRVLYLCLRYALQKGRNPVARVYPMVMERQNSNDRKKDYSTPYPQGPKKKASGIHLEWEDLNGL